MICKEFFGRLAQKTVLSTICTMVSGVSFAATIGVIDSGMDYQHKGLTSQVWVNPSEIVGDEIDNESNGYVDDIFGWNFAERNNIIIDYSYQNTFTQDVETFFILQKKALLGEATAEDLAWMKEILRDEGFLKTIQTFGNYAHGTHVAGISASVAKSNKVIGIKLIPTENPLQSLTDKINIKMQEGEEIGMIMDWLLKIGLDFLAKQQTTIFTQIGSYMNGISADVANGSFGTSSKAVQPLIRTLLELIKGGEVLEKDIEKYSSHLVSRMVFHSKSMMEAAPNTLFVFAAGNDGTDNGMSPVAPANVKAFNAISVGAVFENGDMAPFSNYSISMVDVAAPGVGVESLIPGDLSLVMSGTSQAAPYVAGVAAAIKNENPNLNILDIKAILMGTVDKVASLTDKIKSGGVVNSKRAVAAATLTNDLSVNRSIVRANIEVEDTIKRGFKTPKNSKSFVLPLNSFVGSK